MGNMNTHQPSTGNNNLELHQGYPQNQYPAGNLNTNDPRSHQIPDVYNHPYQNQPRTKNQTQYPQYNQCPTPFSLPNMYDSSPDYMIPQPNINSFCSVLGQAPTSSSIHQFSHPEVSSFPPGSTPANQPSIGHRTPSTETVTQRSNSILPASGQLAAHPNIPSCQATSVKPTSHTQGPPATDSLRGSMAMNTESTGGSRCRQPRILTSDTRERLCTHGLTRLRIMANSNITHFRLTKKIKNKLEELHYEFQCDLHQLAIDHGVAPHLLHEHLGWLQRKRVSTSYNNFAEYDPEALKLFAESELLYYFPQHSFLPLSCVLTAFLLRET
jgi:hypothetical protein